MTSVAAPEAVAVVLIREDEEAFCQAASLVLDFDGMGQGDVIV
jgi:hypothetical protein